MLPAAPAGQLRSCLAPNRPHRMPSNTLPHVAGAEVDDPLEPGASGHHNGSDAVELVLLCERGPRGGVLERLSASRGTREERTRQRSYAPGSWERLLPRRVPSQVEKHAGSRNLRCTCAAARQPAPGAMLTVEQLGREPPQLESLDGRVDGRSVGRFHWHSCAQVHLRRRSCRSLHQRHRSRRSRCIAILDSGAGVCARGGERGCHSTNGAVEWRTSRFFSRGRRYLRRRASEPRAVRAACREADTPSSPPGPDGAAREGAPSWRGIPVPHREFAAA